MDIQTLTIGGLLNVSNDAKLIDKVEIYIKDEWIPLITDISATDQKNLKVIVDAMNPSQMMKISFSSFEELQMIKAIRVTGMVLMEHPHKIMHIASNTIYTNFVKGESNDYGVIVDLQFFTMLLDGESKEDMLKRTLKDFKKYDTTIFQDATTDTVKVERYENTKKTIDAQTSKSLAKELLMKQYPELVQVESITKFERWNLTERIINKKDILPIEEFGREIQQFKII